MGFAGKRTGTYLRKAGRFLEYHQKEMLQKRLHFLPPRRLNHRRLMSAIVQAIRIIWRKRGISISDGHNEAPSN